MGSLSLGPEGSSIQLGVMMEKGFSRVFQWIKVEEKFLLICDERDSLVTAFNTMFIGI